MMEEDDIQEEAIFRADTVPPPAGDDDAYSAPTKVGVMASTVMQEMIVAAQEAAERERRTDAPREDAPSGRAPREPRMSRPPPPMTEQEAGEGAVEEFLDLSPDEDPPNVPLQALAPPRLPFGAPGFHPAHPVAPRPALPPTAPTAPTPMASAPPSTLGLPAFQRRAPIPFIENALAGSPKSRAPIFALVGIAIAATVAFFVLRILEIYR